MIIRIRFNHRTWVAFGCLALLGFSRLDAAEVDSDPWTTGVFRWNSSPPLVQARAQSSGRDDEVSIKDPTIVRHEGRWHVFTTVRMASNKVDILYFNFEDFAEAGKAPRHRLAMHDHYYCAPQVFYFRPHKRWYLVYQLADKNRKPAFGPCFSTTRTLADPKSWTAPQPMVTNAPAEPKWLDFWVICAGEKAHLFYTSLDGHMWRRETKLADFPYGWSEQTLAIEGDIFEASHTYKVQGRDLFVTIIEAQGKGCRYYKAYTARQLEGPWTGLAATIEKPFAGMSNVRQATAWTDNISHGELIRAGVDERMEIENDNVRFLFQGASEVEYRRNYGAIPWKLGLLQWVK